MGKQDRGQTLREQLHEVEAERDGWRGKAQGTGNEIAQAREETESLRVSSTRLQRELANVTEEKSELQAHLQELMRTLGSGKDAMIAVADHEQVVTEARNARKLYEELHQDHEDLRRRKEELEQTVQSLGSREEKSRHELERLRAHLIVQNEEATADALRSSEVTQDLQVQLREAQEQLQTLQARGPETIQVEDEGLRTRVLQLEAELEELRKRAEKEGSESLLKQSAMTNLEAALDMLQAGWSFLFLLTFFFFYFFLLTIPIPSTERDVQAAKIKADFQKQLDLLVSQQQTAQARIRQLEAFFSSSLRLFLVYREYSIPLVLS